MVWCILAAVILLLVGVGYWLIRDITRQAGGFIEWLYKR